MSLNPKYGNISSDKHENFIMPKGKDDNRLYVVCQNRECNPNELVTHTICGTKVRMGNMGYQKYACCPSCYHKISTQIDIMK